MLAKAEQIVVLVTEPLTPRGQQIYTKLEEENNRKE